METPERTMFFGKASNRGYSMLRPFWMRTMAVWPGVTAGVIRSTRVGLISGQFLVTQTI